MKLPAILLARPQMGENIGAAARVMTNFGLTDLRIIAPRDGWPNPAAESMAAGGIAVLQAAQLFDTLEDAAADLQQLYAATARPRELDKPVISAHHLPEALHAAQTGQAPLVTGILFGPERSGLENDELALADAIVTIPISPAYPSLNLAQSVAILAYEASKAAALPCPAQAASAARQPAPKAELQGMLNQLEAELDARHFWKVAEKKPQMWLNLRTMLTRAAFSGQEVRTLRGLIRCLCER